MLANVNSSLPTSGSQAVREVPSAEAHMEKVATEFESVFLSLMLKEMRGTESEEGGLFGGDASDSFGGLFDLYMGQHLASDSPLGIKNLLLDQYRKQAITPSLQLDQIQQSLPSISTTG